MNQDPGRRTIDAYSFGSINVAGKHYTFDLIVYPDRIHEGWRRKQGHRLRKEDLADLEQESFDALIIGTGAHGAMELDTTVQDWLNNLPIHWEAHPTATACERYNALIREGKRTVAALHLTC